MYVLETINKSMTKTITVNYPGGSYGNFLVAFLSKSFNEDSWRSPLLDHHQYNQPKQINFIKTHHNVSDSDQFNIKITYDTDDIDLIFRLKCYKTPWDTEDNIKNIHTRYKDLNDTTKKIVSCCWYKVELKKNLISWNSITPNTLQIPFKYFFLPIDEYVKTWLEIFKVLEIECNDFYLKDTYKKFQSRQITFINDLDFYLKATWYDKDWIARSSVIANIIIKKTKDNANIDLEQYGFISDILISWVYKLDSSNGDINTL